MGDYLLVCWAFEILLIGAQLGDFKFNVPDAHDCIVLVVQLLISFLTFDLDAFQVEVLHLTGQALECLTAVVPYFVA